MGREQESRSFLVLASGLEKAVRRTELIHETERILRRPAGSLRIAHDMAGCPRLLGAPGFISLSHWPGGSALAYDTWGRVGVDVQSFNERQIHAFQTRFGTRGNLPAGLTPARIWTRMEAIGKCLGRGLEAGFDRLFDMATASCPAHAFREWLLERRFAVCLAFENPRAANAVEIGLTGQARLNLEPVAATESLSVTTLHERMKA